MTSYNFVNRCWSRNLITTIISWIRDRYAGRGANWWSTVLIVNRKLINKLSFSCWTPLGQAATWVLINKIQWKEHNYRECSEKLQFDRSQNKIVATKSKSSKTHYRHFNHGKTNVVRFTVWLAVLKIIVFNFPISLVYMCYMSIFYFKLKFKSKN